MSRINGDKSRFHRIRKQRIQQRIRNRELYNLNVNASTSAKPANASGKTGNSPALVKQSKVHSHD